MSYIRNILMSSVAAFDKEAEAGTPPVPPPIKSAKDLQRESIQVTTAGATDVDTEAASDDNGQDDVDTETKTNENDENEAAEVEAKEGAEEETEAVEAVEETEAEIKERKKQERIEKKFAKETQKRREAEAKVKELEAKLAADGKDVLSREDVEKEAETIAQRRIAERDFANACNKLNADATKIDKDFNKKINEVASDIGAIPPVMIGILEDIDNGAAVLNHLANNPDDYEDMYQLSPAKMAISLAKLSVKLIPKPKAKPISQVPEPNTPINGNTRSPNILSDKDSVEDWVAKRNRQVAEARAAGKA